MEETTSLTICDLGLWTEVVKQSKHHIVGVIYTVSIYSVR